VPIGYAPQTLAGPPSGALRLTSADFDAFLEPTTAASRAGGGGGQSLALRSFGGLGPSHGAAAQRRALRERIEAWAHTVAKRLVEIGIAVEVVVPDEVEQHLSSGAPRAIAQRVVFVRDAYARSFVPRTEPELDPLRSHTYLALTIDSVHIAVSLEVCPEAEADVKNTRARIADPTALLELTTLLELMPDEFAIGVLGVPSFPRAQSATAEDIRALLDDSQRNRRPLWMGWSVKREVALLHTDEIDELLADVVVALAHVYKLVAWAPDNDLIAATRRGAWRARRSARAEERRERGREERRKRRKGVRKGPVRKEGSRREREDVRRILKAADRDLPPISRRSSGTSSTSDDPRDQTPPTAGEKTMRFQKEESSTTRIIPPRRPILPTSLRARGAPLGMSDIDPSITIEKGTRVRVLAGPFANRLGIVQELDPKNRARVRLGTLLVATIDMKDIAAIAEGARPKLASSHRRPRNARGG
jgi:transcription antitermination factor NusG